MIEAHSPDPYRSITEPSPEPAFAPRPSEPEPQPEPIEQRRSTVREAARFLLGQSDAPEPPTPARKPERNESAPVESAEITPDRPRRSGWWSRR